MKMKHKIFFKCHYKLHMLRKITYKSSNYLMKFEELLGAVFWLDDESGHVNPVHGLYSGLSGKINSKHTSSKLLRLIEQKLDPSTNEYKILSTWLFN